jgi:hypothetical protein
MRAYWKDWVWGSSRVFDEELKLRPKKRGRESFTVDDCVDENARVGRTSVDFDYHLPVRKGTGVTGEVGGAGGCEVERGHGEVKAGLFVLRLDGKGDEVDVIRDRMTVFITVPSYELDYLPLLVGTCGRLDSTTLSVDVPLEYGVGGDPMWVQNSESSFVVIDDGSDAVEVFR